MGTPSVTRGVSNHLRFFTVQCLQQQGLLFTNTVRSDTHNLLLARTVRVCVWERENRSLYSTSVCLGEREPELVEYECVFGRERGRETQEGRGYGDICICIADSLCDTAETNTPL